MNISTILSFLTLNIFVPLQIRLWNLASCECECTFNGHHGPVTAVRFSSNGSLLASGATDTDIVLWDVTGEAGLFRLRGHRGQITDLAFIDTKSPSPDLGTTTSPASATTGLGRLVSGSKDELIKVWDLNSQHCCQTVVCHGGEVWSLDVDPSQHRLAVGAADIDIRVYSIDGGAATRVVTAMGVMRRSSAERVAVLRYSTTPKGEVVLTCQGAGKVTEMWKARSDAEAQRRRKRRLKRKKEKAKAKDDAGENVDKAGEQDDGVVAGDELEAITTIRCKHKVSSCALCPSTGSNKRRDIVRLVLSLANNSLEVWDVTTTTSSQRIDVSNEDEAIATDKKKSNDADDALPSRAVRTLVIDSQGHRSDVRAVALSSDDSVCLSTSNAGVKIWNPRNGACLQSIEAGYGLSAVFVPGNKHAIIATKEGTLDIIDIGSSARVASIEAHGGPVWSVVALPDGSGVVSGSADKTVKFWEYVITEDGTLGLSQTRTLTMTDDVLCVRITPDGNLLAVSLLDSTVRVFFTDSLKFFLSLYGHKLPVLSMDISSDSTLLVTGSADKNIKIWGLDFGDCHRSLFAHGDSVMSVVFVPGTHYVFTGGKDGAIKYWDVDKFEELLSLEGHHSEVWTLAVSSLGDFLMSGSHDRSLRRWEKTSEPFFIEEEKEKRLESLFEEDAENPASNRSAMPRDGIGVGGAVMESGEAGKRTLESVTAADAIVEALDVAAAEEERMREATAVLSTKSTGKEGDRTGRDVMQRNPLMLGLSPEDYVLRSVSHVRSSELEQALLLVPFADALRLLGYLSSWLKKGPKPELLCRVATLLLRVHMQQLMATPSARSVLIELKYSLRDRIEGFKDCIGYNLAAMGHLQRIAKEQAVVVSSDNGLVDEQMAAAAAAVLPIKRKIEEKSAVTLGRRRKKA